VAPKATPVVKKRVLKSASAPARPRRASAGNGLTEKAQAAEFSRFIDGLEVRLQELDAAMTIVQKRLKG
jgi:hypothetical protein